MLETTYAPRCLQDWQLAVQTELVQKENKNPARPKKKKVKALLKPSS
jgi:hypothetical protein